MSFVLSKVFWIIADPANLLLILMILGLALLATRWRRHGVRLAVACTAILVVLSILPLGDWLLRPLEDRFPAPRALPERIDGIVLLGGSTDPKLSEARGQPALNRAAERIVAFVELGRRYPEARLVATGGSGSLQPGRLTEADIHREVLGQLGFDVARVRFEADSRNTFENARNTFDLMRPQADETWLLITSAVHMPRSVGVFRKAGWPVTPYPVDYLTRPRAGFRLGWGLRGLASLGLAGHEWIGLLAYHLLGRTDALYPAPAVAANP
ncbi:MAG: YdcF family protein [Alphaproteobacteria bacterium]|jgi:uncharacterized SAM-binding protein YcdF (DUF218 family)|nr:YdcF family protein [Alphaproteobacteria bacterium]